MSPKIASVFYLLMLVLFVVGFVGGMGPAFWALLMATLVALPVCGVWEYRHHDFSEEGA
jgi:hypothetical protein